MKAVLGVDGGNTKTDYLLHDLEGKLLAHLRAGTCSHEVLGLGGAQAEMGTRIRALLEKAGLEMGDIVASAFGLAGVDQRVQQQALSDAVCSLGLSRSIVMNDSFLGLKAGSESGIGISSINGTGSAAGGIDRHGKWVQIGGLGDHMSGDKAGGSYIAQRVHGAVYGEIYQFAEKTEMTPLLLARYGCPREDFHTAMSVRYQAERSITALDAIRVLFQASDLGDPVAVAIVDCVADALARSAAGCAVRLDFVGTIPVVLIGSVWTKGRHVRMIDAFQARFEALSGQKASLRILEVPPAAGSVLWALEEATGGVPERAVRERVFAQTKGLVS